MSQQWWLWTHEQPTGPLKFGQLREARDAGNLTRRDRVCREGASAWVYAQDDPTLSMLFVAPPPLPPPLHPPPPASLAPAPESRNRAVDLPIPANNPRGSDKHPFRKSSRDDRSSDEFWPMSKAAVRVLCFAITPIAGAVLHYIWRRKHPAAARFANRTAWWSGAAWFAIMMVVVVAPLALEPPQTSAPSVAGLGAAMTLKTQPHDAAAVEKLRVPTLVRFDPASDVELSSKASFLVFLAGSARRDPYQWTALARTFQLTVDASTTEVQMHAGPSDGQCKDFVSVFSLTSPGLALVRAVTRTDGRVLARFEAWPDDAAQPPTAMVIALEPDPGGCVTALTQWEGTPDAFHGGGGLPAWMHAGRWPGPGKGEPSGARPMIERGCRVSGAEHVLRCDGQEMFPHCNEQLIADVVPVDGSESILLCTSPANHDDRGGEYDHLVLLSSWRALLNTIDVQGASGVVLKEVVDDLLKELQVSFYHAGGSDHGTSTVRFYKWNSSTRELESILEELVISSSTMDEDSTASTSYIGKVTSAANHIAYVFSETHPGREPRAGRQDYAWDPSEFRFERLNR
jgi:hypothetical protein